MDARGSTSGGVAADAFELLLQLIATSKDVGVRDAAELLVDELERESSLNPRDAYNAIGKNSTIVFLKVSYTVEVKDHRHAAGLAIKLLGDREDVNKAELPDDPMKIVTILNEYDGWRPERYDHRAIELLDERIHDIHVIPLSELDKE